MLWYKNWLECKFRVWLCLGLCACILLAVLMNLSPLALKPAPASASGLASRWLTTQWVLEAPRGERVFWQLFLDFFAGVLLPATAIILAGAGVNAQSNWGMSQGFHPSMHFLLSLPVSRQRLFWTRVALGWILLLFCMLATIAALLLIAPLRGLPLQFSIALQVLPYLITGTAVYYSFAVLVSAWLDEFWGGILTLTLTGLLSGYSFAGGPGWFSIVTFMEARPLLVLGQAGWAQGCFYLLLTAAFLAAARHMVNTREY